MRFATLARLRSTLAGILLACSAHSFAEYSIYNENDIKLDLNLTAITAGFENKDSWFGESKNFLGDKTDAWAEFGVEPGLSFEMPLFGGTAFSQVSGIYTNTYKDDASGLTIGSHGAADTTLEQANIGWKVSDLFKGLDDDTLSVTLGRQDYSIGTGMLVNDGGSDGGHRGGWYLGMRKAFQQAAIVSLKSKELVVEVFHLKNNPRHGGTQGDADGFNVEYNFGETVTLGGTYLRVNPDLKTGPEEPRVDDLDVYDARAEIRPIKNLSFSGEFAHEDSNTQVGADGYYEQVAYTLEDVPWSPQLSYRYAHFDGDHPNTPHDEGFHEIAYGYTDYGYWFQGEIAGNYPLGNANIDSHMVRAKAKPNENVTLNLFYYDFKLDTKTIFGTPVGSDHFGDEVDFTCDWQATKRLYVIGVIGALIPGDAAKQWVGGDNNWLYSMLYVSYTL